MRVSSQMEPNKGSLPASRQNSLPDLGLPRMTRKRSSNLRPGVRMGARGSLVRQVLRLQLWRGLAPAHTETDSPLHAVKHPRRGLAGSRSAIQACCMHLVCSAEHAAAACCPWS